MTVRYTGPSDDGRLSVAFAIGKHTGTAVVRNRIRRRLRAALTDLASAGAVPAGAVLVSGRAELATVPFATVRADLHAALTRAASRAEAAS